MGHSSKIGFSFGAASGVITTLGLIVGLTASSASHSIIVSGIITIAVADAFSDALGIHISEESEGVHTKAEVWTATLSTYFSKLIVALSFLIPQVFFAPTVALIISIVWGILLISTLSYFISEGKERISAIMEHVIVAFVVIVAGFVIGQFIKR